MLSEALLMGTIYWIQSVILFFPRISDEPSYVYFFGLLFVNDTYSISFISNALYKELPRICLFCSKNLTFLCVIFANFIYFTFPAQVPWSFFLSKDALIICEWFESMSLLMCFFEIDFLTWSHSAFWPFSYDVDSISRKPFYSHHKNKLHQF